MQTAFQSYNKIDTKIQKHGKANIGSIIQWNTNQLFVMVSVVLSPCSCALPPTEYVPASDVHQQTNQYKPEPFMPACYY